MAKKAKAPSARAVKAAKAKAAAARREARALAREYKLAEAAEAAAKRARKAEAARNRRAYAKAAASEQAAGRAKGGKRAKAARTRNRNERESWILARSVNPRPKSYRDAAERLRELAADTLGVPVSLELELLAGLPGATSGTPWAVVAHMTHDPADYAAMSEVFRAWRDDRELERAIGVNRYARIGVTYEGPESRGGHRLVERDWVASEIAPWDVCASRAVEQTDPDGDDTVANRYESTACSAIHVWISHNEAASVPF